MLFQRSEDELIRLARSGDGRAFTDLIRPHYLSAFRVAFGLLHDRGEAEDAVQEAAFKAWRKLATVRSGAPLRPWFLAIVGNHCKSVRRKGWWSTPRLEVERGNDAPRDLDVAHNLVSGRPLVFLPPTGAGLILGTDTVQGKSVNQFAYMALDTDHSPKATYNFPTPFAKWAVVGGWPHTTTGFCVGIQIDGPTFTELINDSVTPS
jgi:hypothetical protein